MKPLIDGGWLTGSLDLPSDAEPGLEKGINRAREVLRDWEGLDDRQCRVRWSCLKSALQEWQELKRPITLLEYIAEHGLTYNLASGQYEDRSGAKSYGQMFLDAMASPTEELKSLGKVHTACVLYSIILLREASLGYRGAVIALRQPLDRLFGNYKRKQHYSDLRREARNIAKEILRKNPELYGNDVAYLVHAKLPGPTQPKEATVLEWIADLCHDYQRRGRRPKYKK